MRGFVRGWFWVSLLLCCRWWYKITFSKRLQGVVEFKLLGLSREKCGIKANRKIIKDDVALATKFNLPVTKNEFGKVVALVSSQTFFDFPTAKSCKFIFGSQYRFCSLRPIRLPKSLAIQIHWVSCQYCWLQKKDRKKKHFIHASTTWQFI